MLPFLCTSFTSPRNLGSKLQSFHLLPWAGRTTQTPYSSCTYKANTTPRRVLIISPIASAPYFLLWFKKNTWKCHHLVSWAFGSARWVAWSFKFSVLLYFILSFKFHTCLAVFYFLNCSWCAYGRSHQSTIVQLILNKFCAACDRIPYTIEWLFSFRNLSPYCFLNFSSFYALSLYFLNL